MLFQAEERNVPKEKREITVEEWIKCLSDLEEGLEEGDEEAGWQTAAELAELMGVSRDVVLKAVVRAKRAGRLLVRTVRRKDVCGRVQSVPAYKIEA